MRSRIMWLSSIGCAVSLLLVKWFESRPEFAAARDSKIFIFLMLVVVALYGALYGYVSAVVGEKYDKKN